MEDNVLLQDGDKIFFTKYSDIYLFESNGNYVNVYFNENKITILKSLNDIEDKNINFYFRVSRNNIINVNCIKSIDNWFNGGMMLTLNNGSKVEISRRRSIEFKNKYKI